MKYLKIKISAKNENFKVPSFLGSMIRGGFGSSLKDVVCVNPSKICQGCFAAKNCIYYEFFEEKNRFLNYRLDFELFPKKLDFSLYLFNDSIEKYPYILSAIHKMLTYKGLGKNREKFEIENIKIDNEVIYKNGQFENIKIEPKNFKNDNFCPNVKVKFITPLRIKREGRFLKPENLDIKDILISINKKRAFFDSKKEQIKSFPKIVKKDLKMVDFTRYSNIWLDCSEIT